MNYTGRPSISGCRPVLSLYPTHYFCQYLLRIFITFTNSSLFCRAFSTNSRRPLSLASLDTARVAAPSVCFAVARILLAAAPTAPPCFRHWRRSSPLLLPRGGFGIAENFSSSPEAPLLGELSAKQTERLYEGEPDLCSKARPFAPRRAFSVQTKADRHANGSPFGGAGEELATRLRGQGCCQTALAQR